MKKNIIIVLTIVAFLGVTVFLVNEFFIGEEDSQEELLEEEESAENIEDIFASIQNNFYELVERILVMDDDVIAEFEDDILSIKEKISDLTKKLEEDGISVSDTEEKFILIEEEIRALKDEISQEE